MRWNWQARRCRFSSKAALAREAAKAAAIGVSAGGPRLLVLFGARAAVVPILSLSTPDYDRLKLFDSYHCSRYNTNTGVLTAAMFADVVAQIAVELNDNR